MEYNLNFTQAIDELLKGKALKGNDFKKYHYIKLNEFGVLVLVDVINFYKETPYPYILSLSKNTYRVVNVLTLKELEE